MEEILKYFPQLTDFQKEQFKKLKPLYSEWNSRINVISRKDMDNIYIHHVLHSLSVAMLINFVPGTELIDIGTGGGFPGVPLSILFPDSHFTLLDSVEKKLKVAGEIIHELNLKNVDTIRARAEEHKEKYDFVLCRAVMAFPEFVRLTLKNIRKEGNNNLSNGIIYLKGGDLTDELKTFKKNINIFEIKDYFSEPFFETKKIVYLPVR